MSCSSHYHGLALAYNRSTFWLIPLLADCYASFSEDLPGSTYKTASVQKDRPMAILRHHVLVESTHVTFLATCIANGALKTVQQLHCFAGAMLWFEMAAAEGKTPDGYIQPLEKGIIPSNLRVLFSTITKIKQLQYIPVKVCCSRCYCLHQSLPALGTHITEDFLSHEAVCGAGRINCVRKCK